MQGLKGNYMRALEKAPIMYCGIPSLTLKSPGWPETQKLIIAKVEKLGYQPLIPFNLDCGSSTILENHPLVGRRMAFELFEYILKFRHMSFGLCGICDGTMYELRAMLHKRKNGRRFIRTFPDFDPNWDKEYAIWSKVYGDLLGELRGQFTLVVLVGGTAAGKTHWSDDECKEAERRGNLFRRVRNTAPRKPR